MTSIATALSLLRGLVLSLPDKSDPWQGSDPDRKHLDNFQDCRDEEIDFLRQFLDECGPRVHETVAAIEKETLFDSNSSDSENEWDRDGQFPFPGTKIKHHPMRPPVQEFHLDDVSEEAHLAFCELYNDLEFQRASCFREPDRSHLRGVQGNNYPAFPTGSDRKKTRGKAQDNRRNNLGSRAALYHRTIRRQFPGDSRRHPWIHQ
jgi:hypothetical protein